MKISELKLIIDTMEKLGYPEAEIIIDDSRDGKDSHYSATAEPKIIKGQAVLLVR